MIKAAKLKQRKEKETKRRRQVSAKVCGKWQQSFCVCVASRGVCVWQVSASECVVGVGEWQATATIKKEIERTTQASTSLYPCTPLPFRKLCQPSLICYCSICSPFAALLMAVSKINSKMFVLFCGLSLPLSPYLSPSVSFFLLQFISLKWHLVVALVWSVPATPTP